MKLNDKVYDVTNCLENESSEFTIAANSKMFDILSSKIYEDPIRAIVRELSCNAIDANIEAGNIEPIKVYLPNHQFNSLIIEDNGIGMTHDDVMTVYKSYGKSTKSHSDKVIGALGLGGKTPLAYTQQFTLTTAKDGERNQYIIYKDSNGIPNVNRVNTSEAFNETGTSVEVLVKPEDTQNFHKAALKTFLFFDKMPLIVRGEEDFYNVMASLFFDYMTKKTAEDGPAIYEATRNFVKNYNELNKTSDTWNFLSKILKSYGSTHGVVMGQVYYDVNVTQLINTETENACKISINFPAVHGRYDTEFKKLIHIPIGAVSIQPSRESLNYSKTTIEYLKDIFHKDFNEFKADFVKKASTPNNFIKNRNNIPHLPRILVGEFDEIEEFKQINKQFEQHITNKLITGTYMYKPRARRNNRFEVTNIPVYCASNTKGEDYVYDLGKAIMKGEYNTLLIIDEPLVKERLDAFFGKAAAKKKYWTLIPAILENKFQLMNDINIRESIFVDEKTSEIITKMFPEFVSKKTSSFVPIKVPKPRVPKSATLADDKDSYTVYDAISGKYIDPVDALKLTNTTYELFEGKVDQRGYWINPNFKDLKANPKLPRNKAFTIEQKGVMINSEYNKHSMLKNTYIRDFIQQPAHHLMISYNYFKNANIMKNKNWTYIDDYFIKQVSANIDKIVTYMTTHILYGYSIFDYTKSAEYVLELGSKYVGFNDTAFGKEAIRRLEEIKTQETGSARQLSVWNTLTKMLNNTYRTFYDTKVHKDIMKKLVGLDIIIKNFDNSARTDYITDMFNKYPMLKVTQNFSGRAFETKEAFQIVVDYVANVEKLC